jgi:branched-chain amino acid transport system permease protein
MATTTSPAKRSATPTAPPSHRVGKAWPLALTAVAVVIFLLYWKILPNSSQEVQDFFRQWLSVSAVNEAVLWVVFALGLNVVVGYAGLLDLGYVAFWALGGYFAGWTMSPFFDAVNVNVLGHAQPGLTGGIHVNFWLVLPLAGLYCALWGIIIGAPTLRLKSDYLALVTLGFGEIIPQIFRNGEHFGPWNISNGDKGITPIDQIPTWPFSYIPGVPSELGVLPTDLPFKFVVYCLLAALMMFISLRIREGRLGRAWLAIREDELAASMMGVPLMRTKLAAYAVGAFAGGLGGVAFATHVNGVLSDRFTFAISIILLSMVVLGGMGNVWGVTIGALGLAWINSTGLDQGGQAINSAFGTSIDFPSYQYLLFGLILILMMLFRREGLLPEMRTRQVLREPERGQLESVGADLEGEGA